MSWLFILLKRCKEKNELFYLFAQLHVSMKSHWNQNTSWKWCKGFSKPHENKDLIFMHILFQTFRFLKTFLHVIEPLTCFYSRLPLNSRSTSVWDAWNILGFWESILQTSRCEWEGVPVGKLSEHLYSKSQSFAEGFWGLQPERLSSPAQKQDVRETSQPGLVSASSQLGLRPDWYILLFFCPFCLTRQSESLWRSRGVWLSHPEALWEVFCSDRGQTNCSHLVFPSLGVLWFGVGAGKWHFVVFIGPSLLISVLMRWIIELFEVIWGVRQRKFRKFRVSGSRRQSLYRPQTSVQLIKWFMDNFILTCLSKQWKTCVYIFPI